MPQELHPSTLMWDIHRFIKTEHLPKRQVVIYFEFPELRRMKRWWLVIDQEVVDICLEDPGHDVDLTTLLRLTHADRNFHGRPTALSRQVERPHHAHRRHRIDQDHGQVVRSDAIFRREAVAAEGLRGAALGTKRRWPNIRSHVSFQG